MIEDYEVVEYAKQLSNIQFQAYELMNLYSAPIQKEKYQNLIDLCFDLTPIKLRELIKEYPEICETADDMFNCHAVTEAMVQYLGISW